MLFILFCFDLNILFDFFLITFDDLLLVTFEKKKNKLSHEFSTDSRHIS